MMVTHRIRDYIRIGTSLSADQLDTALGRASDEDDGDKEETKQRTGVYSIGNEVAVYL